MKIGIAAVLVVFGFLAAGDVHALAATGNVIRNGKGKGQIRGRSDWDGHRNQGAKDAKDEVKKDPLPAEEKIADLDTTKYDRVAKDLSLTDAQIRRIDDSITSIRTEADKLKKAQTEARAAYEKAADQNAVNNAAANVMVAARSCRSFDPNARFITTLRTVFSREQWEKYSKA